ncbi:MULTISPECIES: cysteine peptidase family C39 domain-containing protein [Methanobacterium]|jgi:predicted double-glycine peptidase|uniref:Peptidase C39 domain-containing protein n=1 Tax=Methanobacterium bryantii TaxID=2161 RepID=A0A2A2H681_METBR|nr:MULTISPECIES: cysteine peptidase family C39 domain-containing protein [Methanobacterium]OEC84585.1 hypothetical protein A9507_02155 [Methanobacterium sp. A39]PAV04887.1 hypothetical protein ASJ80_11300 [Methanobacterium bryantii]
MSNLTKILVFIIFFTILTVFTGTVTASNCTLNPEDPIQLIINNTPYDKAIRNNITDNPISDEVMVNTTGVVMSNTTSNCGPASLATVLQNLSINVSQDMVATIAGTDDNGTTMYGLAQAAQKQGLIVKGLKLKVNELQAWNLVYLTLDNVGHYSIVTRINNTIVYLADSDSGNINMTLTDFTESYIQNKTSEYGYALVITDDSNNPQLNNNNTLTDNEMKSVKGTGSIISEWNTGQNNARIKSIAKSILCNFSGSWKIYGLGIFQWVDSHIKYHDHYNTHHSINQVLDSGYGNCVEQARLCVCLARAMGISYYNVRFVHKPEGYYRDYYEGHKKFPGHVWAQIKWGPGPMDWIDLDTSWSYSTYGWFVDPVTWNQKGARDYPWTLNY